MSSPGRVSYAYMFTRPGVGACTGIGTPTWRPVAVSHTTAVPVDPEAASRLPSGLKPTYGHEADPSTFGKVRATFPEATPIRCVLPSGIPAATNRPSLETQGPHTPAPSCTTRSRPGGVWASTAS